MRERICSRNRLQNPCPLHRSPCQPLQNPCHSLLQSLRRPCHRQSLHIPLHHPHSHHIRYYHRLPDRLQGTLLQVRFRIVLVQLHFLPQIPLDRRPLWLLRRPLGWRLKGYHVSFKCAIKTGFKFYSRTWSFIGDVISGVIVVIGSIVICIVLVVNGALIVIPYGKITGPSSKLKPILHIPDTHRRPILLHIPCRHIRIHRILRVRIPNPCPSHPIHTLKSINAHLRRGNDTNKRINAPNAPPTSIPVPKPPRPPPRPPPP